MLWLVSCSTPVRSANLSSSRSWTFAKRRLSWRASPVNIHGCCPVSATARSKRTSYPVAIVGSGNQSGQPGLQFGHRPGEVHGTLRAQCPSGSGLGAGPSFTRLFGAHPTPTGVSRGQWRPGRLHRTCKEAGEARVDVLGCDLGAAETGACSAAPAGKAETPTQSGSGCCAW